jgi:hypothetical protein
MGRLTSILAQFRTTPHMAQVLYRARVHPDGRVHRSTSHLSLCCSAKLWPPLMSHCRGDPTYHPFELPINRQREIHDELFPPFSVDAVTSGSTSAGHIGDVCRLSSSNPNLPNPLNHGGASASSRLAAVVIEIPVHRRGNLLAVVWASPVSSRDYSRSLWGLIAKQGTTIARRRCLFAADAHLTVVGSPARSVHGKSRAPEFVTSSTLCGPLGVELGHHWGMSAVRW